MFSKFYLLFFSLLLFSGGSAFSQIELRAGLAFGIPMGDLSKSANVAIGLPISAHYLIKEKLGVGLHTGFYNFFTKYDGMSISVIPIAASIEYNFGTAGLIPYLGTDIGIYRYAQSYETNIGGYKSTTTISDMFFGIGPHGGVKYMLSNKIGLNGELKLVNIFGNNSSATFFTIGGGIVLKF